MRIYVAGPMRGFDLHNFPAFAAATKHLRALGHEVWSPAEHDVDVDGFDPAHPVVHTLAHYMERDLPEVCKCDALAMLDGWEKSEGANIEVYIGRAVGKKILKWDTLEEIAQLDFKPTNPKDVAAVAKLDLSLFPETAIAYGSIAMAEGDNKYGAYNYRVGGVLVSVYIGALKRHTAKFYNGEWADEETKVPHLASMLACTAILIDAHCCGVLNDDRPPKVDLSKMFKELQEVNRHLKSIFPNKAERFTQKRQEQDQKLLAFTPDK